MISVEYCQLLARYNHWMNERLYAVVGEFSDEERTRDSRRLLRLDAPDAQSHPVG